MALNLSQRALSLLRQNNIKLQIILELEGFDAIFGAIAVKKFVKIGEDDLIIGGGWFIGVTIENKFSKPYMMLSGGTDTQIDQQVFPDKDGTSSVQNIKVRLADKNEELTKLFSPGTVVTDMLGVKARFGIGFADGAHPEDTVFILNGTINKTVAGAGFWDLNIASPEESKRIDLFEPVEDKLKNFALAEDELLAAIDPIVVTIPLVDASGFLVPAAGFRTFVKIGNEVIEYTGIAVNDLTGCIRGSDGTEPKAHSIGAAVTSFYFLTDDATTISLDSTRGLFLPEDILRTFIRVENEIIEYTGINNNDLTGCIRGSLGSRATVHSLGSDISSYYTLEEDAIPLALKLMLSGPIEEFVSNIPVKSFFNQGLGVDIDNAVFFKESNIQDRYGLVEGDFITTTLADNGANNFVKRTIVSFGIFAGGSFVIVNGAALVAEAGSDAVAAFVSKYNTLTQPGIACEMTPEMVDVARHEFWESTFGTDFPSYRFKLTDSINAKEFIDKDVYFPSALYNIQRQGKTSLNYSIAPLALEEVVIFDETNTIRPSRITIERTTARFFYNNYVYKYDEDPLEDLKFLSNDVLISEDSFNRIKNVGRKTLKIEARGVRTDIDAPIIVPIIQRRQNQRYRFAAERLRNYKVLYKSGFRVEIGDIVIVRGDKLKIADITRGDRRFAPRLMEVINKKLDYASGSVTFDLLDTKFGINNRVGVMSPASKTGVGSTATNLILKRSYATTEDQIERNKWENYIGELVRVKNVDETFDEEVTLTGFSPSNNDEIIVSPALSLAPTEDFIVCIPRYSGDSETKALIKNLHCFVCPSVAITAGIDDFSFTVGGGDIGKFFIDGFVRVRSAEWDTVSDSLKIINIVGNDITLEKTMGFTPDATFRAEGIGFASDKGLPYHYI